MVGQNASRFDNYIVLKSLPKSYTSKKILKTSREGNKTEFESRFCLRK